MKKGRRVSSLKNTLVNQIDRKEKIKMGNVRDLKGMKFGKLTVIELDSLHGKIGASWKCLCECGNTTIARMKHLTYGNTKSCGCLKKELGTIFDIDDNKESYRIYHIWNGMKSRCYSKNNDSYHNYGGRGIEICNEWLNDFMSFYNWAINNGYSNELSIDRIEVNGNYEPSNCRWATDKEQQNNRRNNLHVTINGVTKTGAQWEDEYDLARGSVGKRISIGWSGEDLLEKPKVANKQSGVKYITWNKSKEIWRVRKRINGIEHYIGYSKDLNEAIKILEEYNKASKLS